MDSFTSLATRISEDIYRDLKSALELGKWNTGVVLTDKQKEISLQLVIAYENLHLKQEERTAYIQPKVHEPCDSAGGQAEEQVIKFK